MTNPLSDQCYQKIYAAIQAQKEPQTKQQIAAATGYKPSTIIVKAIPELKKQHLIKAVPCLNDMRLVKYAVI